MLPDNRNIKKENISDISGKKNNGSYTSPYEIINIPAEKDFIKILVSGILKEVGCDPLALADYTIILPTRANCNALRDAFVELSEANSVILPRIYTPRDFDDEEASLKISDSSILSEALMDLPPAISPLQRKLLLANEILCVEGMASSPAKAIRLAEELGRFLDFTQKHGVELKNLEKLAPIEFTEQWNKTKDFLEILTDKWPKKLAKLGMIDPQERKNIVTSIQAAHLQHFSTDKNIVMAGFSSTTNAEKELISAVAHLPKGKVILTGMDNLLDEDSWEKIDEAHPQYGIKQILDSLNISRNDVKEWKINIDKNKTQSSRSHNLDISSQARKKLISEAMRPAVSADKWLKLKAATPTRRKRKKQSENEVDVRALTGMDLATCGTPQQEASIIALKMREVLETPDKSIALVTNDRTLARRVAARLKYWDIDVQDSVGRALVDTETGIWLRLTAAMAADNLSPVTLLSCLKHPYACLGDNRENTLQKTILLENHLLRGPRPEAGLKGIKKRLSGIFNSKAKKISKHKEELEILNDWLNNIEKITNSFLKDMQGKKLPFAKLLDGHIKFAEMLANDDKAQGATKLWSGNAGFKAAKFLAELRKYASDMPDMTGEEYTGVITTLMKSVTVRPKASSHSNLYIMSPKEARLFKANVMIMGSLNENSWPSPINEINWLSRDMLEKIKLPSPDLHMGKLAYDFTQILSSPDILLTRAERNGDVPTVASPFLTRLRMVLQKTGMLDKLESKTQLASINDALNTPSTVKPITPPEPRPPKGARPKKLSVSNIETLLRDPYSLYARQILKFFPKEPLDAEPSARERGNFIHEILDKFIRKYPDEMPKDAYDRLIDIGKDIFDERMDNPTVRAFWWPRFEYIAEWFVKEETTRREFSKTEATEVKGQLDIETKNGKFTLTAIADRIDRMVDDRLAIIDYKTGTVPTKSAVSRGFSPQLTLEALIALAGGFKDVEASEVGSLEYWKLTGGKPPGKIIPINDDINKLEQEALDGLSSLIETFLDENTPYMNNPRPRLAPRFNNYKHLSREDEWKYEYQAKKTSTTKKANIKKMVKRRQNGK